MSDTAPATASRAMMRRYGAAAKARRRARERVVSAAGGQAAVELAACESAITR
jgi:hypothetical protein